MDGKQQKLENPARIKELDPEGTLKKIGLHFDSAFCDIGAGSGVFTVPAAGLTNGRVYALDLSDEMLSIIKEKACINRLANIEVKKAAPDSFFMEDQSVDIALMATVLHEIPDKPGFLKIVKKMLKDDGKAAVIEFHKKTTPMGPPAARRIGKDEVVDELQQAGFQLLDDFDLGENFYCLVFKNN